VRGLTKYLAGSNMSSVNPIEAKYIPGGQVKKDNLDLENTRRYKSCQKIYS